MMRPTKLHIHPEEKYPSERLLNVPFHVPPYIMEEMPQMSFFVHDFYTRV